MRHRIRMKIMRRFGWRRRSAPAFTLRPARLGTGPQGAGRCGAGPFDGNRARSCGGGTRAAACGMNVAMSGDTLGKHATFKLVNFQATSIPSAPFRSGACRGVARQIQYGNPWANFGSLEFEAFREKAYFSASGQVVGNFTFK